MSEKSEKEVFPFKFNLATLILLMIIVIPLIYTVVVNLQKPEPAPIITPAPTAITQGINPASAIDNALQIANVKPGYDSYINLGLAYYNATRYKKVSRPGKKRWYNPKGDLAYNNIAAAYGSLKNYDAEIEICQQALAINPKLDIARRNMAWATEMKNKK